MVKKKGGSKKDCKKDFSCKPKKSLNNSLRENPWILATFILVILSLALFFGNFFGGVTGATITGSIISESGGAVSFSADDARQAVIDFAAIQGIEIVVLGVTEKSSFYEVLILVQSQELPVYITKDGKYFVQGLIPFKETMEMIKKQNVSTPRINEQTISKADGGIGTEQEVEI